jgi:uncharacterized protein (DUF427 family)
MKAVWNSVTLVESDDTASVEGNHYFPIDKINRMYFVPSDTTTVCPWKGVASYFNIVVDGKANPDAAWTYKSPKPGAEAVAGRIAFWKGVEVTQ